MIVLVLEMCWPGSMGVARTAEISVGVRTWQASVTGVVVAATEVGFAVGSVGVEEWQPRSSKVVVSTANRLWMVDIFGGLLRAGSGRSFGMDFGPGGYSGMRWIIAGW